MLTYLIFNHEVINNVLALSSSILVFFGCVLSETARYSSVRGKVGGV